MNPVFDSPGGFPATVYVAICLPADAMPGALARIQRALADAARKTSEAGRPVHYVNGMYMPAQHRLLCVFTAACTEAVDATVERVRLPYERIKAVTEGPAPA